MSIFDLNVALKLNKRSLGTEIIFDKKEDSFSYEAKLDPNISPVFQASFKIPEPVMANFSILDKSAQELGGMDINVVREALMNEIKSLKYVTEEKRNVQLQKIFGKLLDLEPVSSGGFMDDNKCSHRLFVDLISTPGLATIPYVKQFLKNDFVGGVTAISATKKNMFLKLLNYYAKHSQEEIDVFNYIFKSSEEIVITLLYEHDLKLDDYFNTRAINAFDKEDLCQLFRFYFSGDSGRDDLRSLFKKNNAKQLFLLSQMTKKIKALTGHSAEFIEAGLGMFLYGETFGHLLDDIYDKVVGGKEKEKAFENTFLENDDFYLMRELINYIVLCDYDRDGYNHEISQAKTMEEFISLTKKYRFDLHKWVLGEEALEKIEKGTFDLKANVPVIKNEHDLYKFKKAFLYNTYGISVEEAKHIKEHYSGYMSELEEDILEEDRDILEMLKAINKIIGLSLKSPTFKEEIQVLYEAYYSLIERKGLEYENGVASAFVVEGLLNRMFMNTYNKQLLKANSKTPVIKVDDGVCLLDAGVKFDIILTSLAGAGEFYQEDTNMAAKWNTMMYANNQGLCASHISNSNIGIIDLIEPVLGFNSIPKDSLNAMGISDIYSYSTHYNLRKINGGGQGDNKFFVPCSVMSNETRYGYNEILIDRFLMNDEDNKLKLQPDYVVFYKLNDNYESESIYHQTLKVAKDFGIPIMVIDVPKIKSNERLEILKMEEELLDRDEVNVDLMKKIITRYMNNYTGSLTLKEYGYEEDFSIGYMRRFFNLVMKKIDHLDDKKMKREWLDALEGAYLMERDRFKVARNVSTYKYSVRSFVLKNYDLEDRILKMRVSIGKDKVPKKENREDKEKKDYKKLSLSFNSQEKRNSTFYQYKDFTQEKDGIVALLTLFDMDNGTSFEMKSYNFLGNFGVLLESKPTQDKEMALLENLVISYFYENCHQTGVTDLILDNAKTKIDFNTSENYNWNEEIINSPFRELLDPNNPNHIKLDEKKIDMVIECVEAVSEKRFLDVFDGLIYEQYEKNNQVCEVIATRLLDKKSSLRDAFWLLKKQVKAMEEGKDPLNIGTGKKQ